MLAVLIAAAHHLAAAAVRRGKVVPGVVLALHPWAQVARPIAAYSWPAGSNSITVPLMKVTPGADPYSPAPCA